jgi:hypothetical protein
MLFSGDLGLRSQFEEAVLMATFGVAVMFTFVGFGCWVLRHWHGRWRHKKLLTVLSVSLVIIQVAFLLATTVIIFLWSRIFSVTSTIEYIKILAAGMFDAAAIYVSSILNIILWIGLYRAIKRSET